MDTLNDDSNNSNSLLGTPMYNMNSLIEYNRNLVLSNHEELTQVLQSELEASISNNFNVEVDFDSDAKMTSLCNSFSKIECEDHKGIPCSLCSFRAKHKKSLKLHYITQHRKDNRLSRRDGAIQKKNCKFCENRKKSTMNSAAHSTLKRETSDIRCKFCRHNDRKKNDHSIKIDIDDQLRKNKNLLKCGLCYFTSIGSDSLRSHYQRRHGVDMVIPYYWGDDNGQLLGSLAIQQGFQAHLIKNSTLKSRSDC